MMPNQGSGMVADEPIEGQREPFRGAQLEIPGSASQQKPRRSG